MGNHWEPFFDDVELFFERLPSIIEQARVQSGYADFFPAQHQKPDDWSDGFHMVWPIATSGVMLTIKIENTQNSIHSFYPYHQTGMQQRLTLERILVVRAGCKEDFGVAKTKHHSKTRTD